MRPAGVKDGSGGGAAMFSVRQTRVQMDTAVTVEAVLEDGQDPDAVGLPAIERAFGWFAEVESHCSRFDPASELRRCATQVGEPVAVSPLLFEAVRFALGVAEDSGGVFDPTVGAHQEARGFTREYRSGGAHPSGVAAEPGVSWRDVELDTEARTITLRRALLLDLGAVAKGLAVDLALHELRGLRGAVVEAGGDLAVAGVNSAGEPWRLGIRHPRRPGAMAARLILDSGAICTSGDYERRSPADGGSHLLDPRTGRAAAALASCSVVAPNAMLADALSTAAGLMPPEEAVRWLEGQGVEGLLFTQAMQRYTTRGFARLETCL